MKNGIKSVISDKHNYCWLAGIVIGLITIIFAIVVFSASPWVSSGYSSSSVQYGADFYTDAARGINDTFINIAHMSVIIQKGLGFLLLSLGLFMCCFSGAHLTFPTIEVASEECATESPLDECASDEAPEAVEEPAVALDADTSLAEEPAVEESTAEEPESK